MVLVLLAVLQATPSLDARVMERVELCRNTCAVTASRCGKADCPPPRGVTCSPNNTSPACTAFARYSACTSACDTPIFESLDSAARGLENARFASTVAVVDGQLQVEGISPLEDDGRGPCRFWKDAEACRESCLAGSLRSCRHFTVLSPSESASRALLETVCRRGDAVSCAELTRAEPPGTAVEARLRTLALGLRGCDEGNDARACWGAALAARQLQAAGWIARPSQRGCKLGEPEACTIAVQQLRHDYPQANYWGEFATAFYAQLSSRCTGGDSWACWNHARALAGWVPWVSGREPHGEQDYRTAISGFRALCDQGHQEACTQLELTQRDLANAEEQRRLAEAAERERQRQEQERQRQEQERQYQAERDREERRRQREEREDEQRVAEAQRRNQERLDELQNQQRERDSAEQARRDSAQRWEDVQRQVAADARQQQQRMQDQFAATQRSLDAARQRDEAARAQGQAHQQRQAQAERDRADRVEHARQAAAQRLQEQVAFRERQLQEQRDRQEREKREARERAEREAAERKAREEQAERARQQQLADDRARREREEAQRCTAATQCLSIQSMAKTNYCANIGRDGKDFLPMLRNGCGKDIACKVCGTGSDDHCMTWDFKAGAVEGGWASAFTWCGITRVTWRCVEGQLSGRLHCLEGHR